MTTLPTAVTLPLGWQPDAVALAYLAQSLNEHLLGARVQKIQHLTHREWVLTVFSPHRHDERHLDGEESKVDRLYVSVDKQHPAVCLLSASDVSDLVKPTFTKPTNDCMLLRKHLLHGRIRSVTALQGERAIVITIENTNELGQVVPWQWVLEVMGRYSTWWLVEGDTQTIVGSAYRVTESMSAHRPLAVGNRYVAPPAPAGRDWLGVLPISTLAAVIETYQSHSPKVLAAELLAVGYGASPAMLQAIVTSCRGQAGVMASAEVIAQRLHQVLNADSSWKPIQTPNNEESDGLAALSLLWGTGPCELEIPWAQALSRFQRDALKQQRLAKIKNHCLQAVDREGERLKQRILTQQPTESPEAIAEWELRGHALMTAASQHTPQACPSSDRVPVMHPETGEPWLVAVNPEKSWRDNAKQAYQHVKKATEQRKQWDKAAEILQHRKVQLAQWVWEIQQLATLPEAWALMESLGVAGIVKLPQHTVGPRKGQERGHGNSQAKGKITKSHAKQGHFKKESSTTPKASSLAGLSRWENPDGIVFWMGRQGEANATLLSKIARHNDVWCHAWNQPGAHVVIQRPLAECDDDTLLDGLMLAAIHSQQGGGWEGGLQSNTAIKVDVVFTECRHVRAVPHSYAGHVTYKQEKTALIAIEPRRLKERLSMKNLE